MNTDPDPRLDPRGTIAPRAGKTVETGVTIGMALVCFGSLLMFGGRSLNQFTHPRQRLDGSSGMELQLDAFWVAGLLGTLALLLWGLLYILMRREPANCQRSMTDIGQGPGALSLRCREGGPSRLAENLLRDSEAGVRRLLQLLPEPVIIHGGGRISFANAAAQRLLGADESALLGRAVRDFFDTNSAVVQDAQQQVPHSGAATQTPLTERIKCLDGATRIVEVSTTPIQSLDQLAVLVVCRDVTAQRQTEAELVQSHAELRQLFAQQGQVQEDERKRIARELHDDLQQTLATITIMIDAVAPVDTAAMAHAGLSALLPKIDELAQAAIESTRRIVVDLRPQTLDNQEFVEALRELAAAFTRRAGVVCKLAVAGEVDLSMRAQPAVATCLYRVAQESLNNAAKHARANEVLLHVAIDAEHRVLLQVRDDGCGFSTAERRKPESFGLIGMHERVRALDGDMHISSCAGEGTVIQARIPLAPGQSLSSGRVKTDQRGVRALRI